jgi:HK97 family phage major capsid protein
MLKALSLSERQTLVRQAVYALAPWGDDLWVIEIYDDFVIVEDWSLFGYWRANYTLGEMQTVTLQPRTEWVRVEQEWQALKAAQMLANFSPGLKALGDGKVGGYLVVFGDEGSTDLAGDFFTKATDFDITDGDRVTVYYQHGLDPVLKRRKLGTGTLKTDDAGIWMEAQLNLRDAYEQNIYTMIGAGKMGLSSGTLPNLVEREWTGKAFHIKSWPLGKDGSVTPTPAEFRTGVLPLKSLFDSTQAVKPEATPEAQAMGGGAADTRKAANIQISEGKSMTDPNVTPPAKKSLDERVDQLSDTLNKFMKMMEDSPALKSAGYFTEDGGTADPAVKSFGDFLKAVQRKDEKRLATVYNSRKALNSDTGDTGGYLVPDEYHKELLRVTLENSPILRKVKRVPVTGNAGKYPALDNYTAPTAGSGQTAAAGGVKTTKRQQGEEYTETEPNFEMIEYKINDAVSGFTKVSKEMMSDSPFAIEALLKDLIGIADAARQEFYVLNGSGIGEPLGILTAPATIGVTAATAGTFAYVDVLKMRSRFKPFTANASWLIHQSLWPDIGTMKNGDSAVFQANLGESLGMRLNGVSIDESQHLPQADNNGCAVLADWGAYLLFEKGGLEIDFSEHADFLKGNNVWRFSHRMDGQPWMRGPITLADPQGGYTISPFVKLNNT